MNKRTIFCTLFLIMLIIVPALAETTIKAEVDRKVMTTDDELVYKLVVASNKRVLPSPEFPKFEGFSILSQADSSTMSFLKGEIKTILVYAVILVPNGTGKFTISPAMLKLKDKTYSSDSFEIEVTQGKNIPEVLPKEKPPLPGQPQSEEPQTTL